MVLACESIFSRTSLDGRPQNLYTFSNVNLKYTKCSFPVGQARCSFHLPHSYNLQILLAWGNGASTNVEPCQWLITYSCYFIISNNRMNSMAVLMHACCNTNPSLRKLVTFPTNRWQHQWWINKTLSLAHYGGRIEKSGSRERSCTVSMWSDPWG